MSLPSWRRKWPNFRWRYHPHKTVTSTPCRQLVTMSNFANVRQISHNSSLINVLLTRAEILAHVTTVFYTYPHKQFYNEHNPMLPTHTCFNDVWVELFIFFLTRSSTYPHAVELFLFFLDKKFYFPYAVELFIFFLTKSSTYPHAVELFIFFMTKNSTFQLQ